MKFYKNILKTFLISLFLLTVGGVTVLAINNWTSGYKLAANTWTNVVFNKYSSGSTTVDMQVRNSSSNNYFVGTKTNAEFSSFAKKPPASVYMYKEYNFNVSNCAKWAVYGQPNSNREMVKNLYVPASGKYRFYMKIQRQNFENYEDFYLYVDLNKDGDYNDAGEYLGRSNDTGTDDNAVANWKWKWMATNTDGSGSRVYRDLSAGSYNFKMKAVHSSSNTNVGIGYLRLYAY